MKKAILLILLGLASFCIQAQTFTGRIVDNNLQPVSYVNIIILQPTDSSFVKGAVTGNDGKFSIDVPDNNYLLKISCIGYKPQYLAKKPDNLGDLKLSPDTTLLKEVKVIGNIPLYKFTEEGLETEVENTVLSKMGTANDVLQHVPGLLKDGDTYIVFGKGAPIFYINDRLVRNLTELDQLSSKNIKSVELIQNPGAKYDASVRAVVKIKTKRPQGDGMSLDNRLTYGQSQNTDLTEELNLNYRHKQLDVFGMFYYSSDNDYNHSSITQTIKADTLWHQENKNHFTSSEKWLQGEIGFDYSFGKNSSIGMRYDMDKMLNTTDGVDFSSIVTADGKYYDELHNKGVLYNYAPLAHAVNFYYSGNIGDLSIDFNADWKKSGTSKDASYQENSNEEDNMHLNTYNSVKNNLYASKLDFFLPMLGGKLTAGTELTSTDRKDDYSSLEGYLAISPAELKDQGIAIYSEYQHPFSCGLVKAGLRYEHVRFKYYNNRQFLSDMSRSFDNFFPSLAVMGQVGKVRMELSYTSKIRRPTYSELSGNVTYANRFTLETGNPYLKPSIIHNASLRGMWKTLAFNVSFTDTKDAVINWTTQKSGNSAVSILGKKNINSLPNLTAMVQFSPTWGIWYPQAILGISKQWLNLITDLGKIKMNSPIWLVQLNNSFEFSNTLTGDCSIRFISKGNQANLSLMRAHALTNISLTKSFLNDRLSVKLAGYDLFKTSQRVKAFNQQMWFSQINNTDTRYVELTISYKFNITDSKYKGTGAGNSEKDRL